MARADARSGGVDEGVRKQIRAFADAHGAASWRVRIFETSGTTKGQATAFALLGHGGYLSVVGYTPQSVELRLSNLMAFDATVQGNWGCLPEHYPAIVDLVLTRRVALAPFIEHRPLATINDVHRAAGRRAARLVLIPRAITPQDHDLTARTVAIRRAARAGPHVAASP
jgi:6-hydroxycyclohex-1-ene-1-carbonyl-CoA dehydrogenase